MCASIEDMVDSSPELILREKMQLLVRAFGMLSNQTPCGKPISVSAAHALMVMHAQDPGSPFLQTDLQKVLQLDKSNVTRLCGALEEDGFILQRPFEDDRRARHIRLTKKGERLAASLLAASQQRFAEILNQIPSSQHRQIVESLDFLIEAIHGANAKRNEK
jgi:MarR family transcriptional regulator for hemolysin